MPVRTLFDNLPLGGVFASILAVIMIAVEVGYVLGKFRRERPKQEKEASVSAMVGATLGLLAFMLAFTFGLAASRFDARRIALVDESNALATAYLRAGLVPEPHRTEIRSLLSEYVDIRLSVLQPGGNVEQAVRKSNELHKGDVLVQVQWVGGEIVNLSYSDKDEVDEILQSSQRDRIDLTVKKPNGQLKTVRLIKKVLHILRFYIVVNACL